VGSAFVVGTAVNTALYGGVARCEVVTTSFAGSSVTVTVTGTNDLGNTGRTWTATVAANGSVVLTPGVSTDLLVSVSGITIPGGMTAGTVTVQGLPPAGRTDPPV
jgi:hypothetical protein